MCAENRTQFYHDVEEEMKEVYKLLWVIRNHHNCYWFEFFFINYLEKKSLYFDHSFSLFFTHLSATHVTCSHSSRTFCCRFPKYDYYISYSDLIFFLLSLSFSHACVGRCIFTRSIFALADLCVFFRLPPYNRNYTHENQMWLFTSD